MPILQAETSVHPPSLLEELPVAQRTGRRWWAVYTKARQEKALARQLLQMDIPFYLPLVPKDNVIRGRRVQSFIPLFGGYLFLFGDEEERVTTLTTNRISTILSIKDQERVIRDLRSIRCLIAANAPLTIERRLAKGDAVRVRTGPFAGAEGIVEQRRAGRHLIVTINALQQQVSVELDDCRLDRI